MFEKLAFRFYILSMFFLVLSMAFLGATLAIPSLTFMPVVVSAGIGTAFGLAMLVCVGVEFWG